MSTITPIGLLIRNGQIDEAARHVVELLEKHGFDKKATSKAIGVAPVTLHSWINDHEAIADAVKQREIEFARGMLDKVKSEA